MPAGPAVAEATWEAPAPAADKTRGVAGSVSRRSNRVKAARLAAQSRSTFGASALPVEDRKTRVSPRVFAGLVRIGEFALLSGLGFLIAYFYVAEFFRQYAAALALTGLVSVAVFQALGLYTIPAFSSPHSRLARLLTGWTATVGVLLAAVFFLKLAPEFSRVWLALWYAGGAAALIAYRAGVAALTRRGLVNGSLTRRAIVYGTGPASESLLEALELRSHQRHPRLRRVRRPRGRPGGTHDCRLSQPRQC